MSMKTESLIVVANQRRMGEVTFASNRLGFEYDAAWQGWESAYPLSVSMPLPQKEHTHAVVEAFLWGLLPDNQQTFDAWGRRFHVSSRNAFRLLQHVGEDCAGAIQFAQPERESEVLTKKYQEQVDWIDAKGLEERLQRVLQNHGDQRVSSDRGQFSLAGAQPKIALYQSPKDGRWGVPYGLTPTTHILKPASAGFDGFAENEHFCLRLASRVGLRTTASQVILADSIPTIVVKRYDRVAKNGLWLRIHQEDMCQALGVPPDRKYQSEGGPGIGQIADLIRSVSDHPVEDIETFAKSLIFNFLISGTDAHAKNYAIIIAPSAQIRLAPLYDLASSLPYPKSISPYKARMAMKIGGEYQIRNIQKRHWEACSKELGLRWPIFRGFFRDVSEAALSHASTVQNEISTEGLSNPVIGTIRQNLEERIVTFQKGYF